MEYETVIGLEVHVELSTETKIFCACSTAFGGEPNAHTCPVCLGMPGSLPVLNRRVVEKAVRAGLALNCSIQADNRFDRKNYFYPDLPKDYQISQLYRPICRDGFVTIEAGGREKRVRIHEIHMEEDAGKLLHDAGGSLVDFNRCGVPLIEIVSEPDLRSAEEVMAYLEKLREILMYTEVSDCRMQEGSMRADVNLSVRPVGASAYGTRTETKNMNSFKAIQRAIEYENRRQIAVLAGGGSITQETRRWDDEKGENYAMRSKENAQDYRYFPDPDLLPVHVSAEWIESIRAELPELADRKRARYMRDFSIDARAAGVLTASRSIARLFEEAALASGHAREAANIVAGDILRLVKETGADPDEIATDGKKLGAAIRLIAEGKINRTVGKTVVEELFRHDVDPEAYVRAHDLLIVHDNDLIEDAAKRALAENPQSVADYKAGKQKAFGFLVGRAMQTLKGQADPKAVSAALKKFLGEDETKGMKYASSFVVSDKNPRAGADAPADEASGASGAPGQTAAETAAPQVYRGANDPLGEARAQAEATRTAQTAEQPDARAQAEETQAEAPQAARPQTALTALRRRWAEEGAQAAQGRRAGGHLHTGQPEIEFAGGASGESALPGLPNRYRTKTCADLGPADVGGEERLAGWIQTIRNHGGVAFADLRDHYGVTQVVVTEEQLLGLHRESVISVRGRVLLRDPETVNPNIATGLVELKAEELTVLGESLQSLPFEVDASTDTREDLRLRYRFLDLRNPKLHDNIVLRAEIIRFLRSKMENLGFIEIQTPILANSSPEGARDYLVPSRKHKGKFYALPQAPQQFKQLLMAAGFDRYFQIAPCFRDEDARLDRSPGEFYQLDFEMAFATQEDVFAVAEQVLVSTFKRFSDKAVSEAPFVRIPFEEAMLRYGTDKPDLRNPLLLRDLSAYFAAVDVAPFKGRTVRGVVVPQAAKQPRSFFSSMEKFALSIGMKGLGYIAVNEDMRYKGPIDKFFTEAQREEIARLAALKPHDVLYFISDEPALAAKYAGQIRTELAERLGLIAEDRYEFCFITDFPMYEINEESGQINFTHNPFSMPQGEMEALLSKDPLTVMAWQYDIVCNGVELSSGAVRNHRPDVMVKAFEIAGYSEKDVKEKFGALYNAFRYGAPPHAGMAPGVDRIVMLLTGETNIREIIPFPLDSNARNLLLDAPSEVTEAQLREVHIKLR